MLGNSRRSCCHNLEILSQYEIGKAFDRTKAGGLQKGIEDFVDTFEDKKNRYESELKRAYYDFHPPKLAKTIIKAAES